MGNRHDPLAAFSPDYATARNRFREAADRLGWRLEAHPVKAPQGVDDDLTIDVALSPGRDDSRAVVVSSGLHGAEGFIGSAVQVGLLEQWAATAPRIDLPVRCVFVHALNPYGFAFIRRVNEENVDPNRNFLLPGQEYKGSPATYAALNHFLNPQHPPSALEPFALKAVYVTFKYGRAALKQAIAEGQFDFPKGIFFGGSRPTRTNEVLSENLARWLQGCNDVIHLDFHTGLGPRATCKILIDYPLSGRQLARLNTWFGPDSYEICDPKLISYHVRGGFDRWCVSRIPGCDYLHLCAEYGTYSPIEVVRGLRAENQAYHWGRSTDRSARETKTRLKELFCPAAPDWRQRTYETGVDLVGKAISCLSAAANSKGDSSGT
jgi:hypothetical protein